MLSWRQVLGFLREELPIAAMSQLALLLGGLVLLTFFVRLGFMPEISLESALTLFYAAAMLGLGVMALMVSALVLPAVCLRYALPWPSEGPAKGKLLISSLLAALAWLGYYSVWMKCPDLHGELGTAIAFLAGLSVVFWAVLFIQERWARSKPWLFYAMAGAQQFAVLVLPLLIVSGLMAGGDLGHAPVWLGLGYLALLLLVLACIVTVQALLMDKNRRLVMALGGAYLVWAVLITGSAGSAFDGLMASLQWGNVQPVRVVLTRTGCEQLNLAVGRTVCQLPAAAEGAVAVCSLNIRSRVGAQVLLAPEIAAASEEVTKQPEWQVVLDRKELLAWSRLPKHAVSQCTDRLPTIPSQ